VSDGWPRLCASTSISAAPISPTRSDPPGIQNLLHESTTEDLCNLSTISALFRQSELGKFVHVLASKYPPNADSHLPQCRRDKTRSRPKGHPANLPSGREWRWEGDEHRQTHSFYITSKPLVRAAAQNELSPL